MAGSSARINYSLRPAKHIERRMIAESLRHVAPFAHIEAYRYMGFGGLYFSDFALFHRMLNVRDMVSVEIDTNSKERYEFNKPYDCISLEFGKSSQVLPRLKWDKR